MGIVTIDGGRLLSLLTEVGRRRALTLSEAIAALSSPIIQRAAAFGAAYVRLGTGQRIALDGHVVVTVLPKEQRVKCLGIHRERPEYAQSHPTGGEVE